MKITPTDLHGACLIDQPSSEDERGTFVKTFHESTLRAHQIEFTLRESYYSLSRKDVIRGMHFQTPPHQHSKIVFCQAGSILDVIIDLRKDSPDFLKIFVHELSAANKKALYIPEGFAHGFRSLEDGTLTYYLVSTEYHKASDTGIRFDTIGYDWNVAAPILSARDLSFRSLQDFESPF